MLFNPFQMAVQFFKTASNFPNIDDPNAFFPNSTGPWPRLQKGRKIPGHHPLKTSDMIELPTELLLNFRHHLINFLYAA